MTRRKFLESSALASVAVSSPWTPNWINAEIDIAILGGRVIDPETKFDQVCNIGIHKGTIRVITKNSIRAKTDIDAAGLVVCPGFIDPISHGQNLENDKLQVLDGVTTKLQLEAGAEDVNAWYADQLGKRICNYGAGTSHVFARTKVLGDESRSGTDVATEDQIIQMANFIRKGLQFGGIAVGFGLEYQPAATRSEVMAMFEVAGEFGASCHCHVRYGTVNDNESEIVGIQEVLVAAILAKTPLHIVHVPSMGLGRTAEALKLIERAQARGIDITCDFYPYTAFGTGIDTEVFSDGWQKRFGISYQDLEWAKTHERLTQESFEKYKKEGGMVLAHAIPESAISSSLKSTATMVGSDGGLKDGIGHPRSTGTFSRVLGHYSRDLGLITLPEAIKKVTFMAAKRMQHRCPEFKKKGRIQKGCHADILVFDSEKIMDRATFSEPALTSIGVVHTIIGGTQVVRDGVLVENQFAGRPLRAPQIS